jgi:hypothetical protein
MPYEALLSNIVALEIKFLPLEIWEKYSNHECDYSVVMGKNNIKLKPHLTHYIYILAP